MTHEEAISILEESAINAGLCAEKESLTPAESLLKWPEIRTALEKVRAQRDRYREALVWIRNRSRSTYGSCVGELGDKAEEALGE